MSDVTADGGRSERLFQILKRRAERKTLLVSPPYGEERAERAFLSGYETALRDMAKGRLDG